MDTHSAELTYSKASPQPLDDTFLNTAMPPSLVQHHVLVLQQAGIFPLDEHLLRLFTAEEGNLLRELDEPGVRVPELA